MLIAHNSNSDSRFLIKHIRKMAPPIDKNNKFIYIKGEFNRYNNPDQIINITIKDSYRLIPMALSEFGECFKLDVEKEIMPYDLYTEENLNREYVPIKDAIGVITRSIKLKFYKKNKDEEEIP